jgi:hypothetical protein
VSGIPARLVNKQTELQLKYLNKQVSVRDFLSKYSNCRSVCLLTSLLVRELIQENNGGTSVLPFVDHRRTATEL